MSGPSESRGIDTRSTHFLVELWDADRGALGSVERTREILLEAARVAQVTVLHSAFHAFRSGGVSGVALIAESHITVHTWPEVGYAACDIFTCGSGALPEAAAAHLASAFGARQVDVRPICRGARAQRSNGPERA